MAKSQTKAKTTKPALAAKVADAATTAITMTQDLRLIRLDQLELSPLNVRKVAASATDDAELLASIRENGIKQNLVVHALPDGKFAVDAGGRRLKALKQLANDGVIPNDHPVSCLAADYDVAFDAMLYALCEQALSRSYGTEALNISISPFLAQNREALHADTVAQKMLDALEQDLAVEWMTLEKPDDFRAMSALSLPQKQSLFAWAVGLAVKPQLLSDNHPTPIIEEIGARLDVDVAACWRPTASTYWGRVNKGHAVSMARKLVGDDYAEERSRERKEVQSDPVWIRGAMDQRVGAECSSPKPQCAPSIKSPCPAKKEGGAFLAEQFSAVAAFSAALRSQGMRSSRRRPCYRPIQIGSDQTEEQDHAPSRQNQPRRQRPHVRNPRPPRPSWRKAQTR